MLLIAMMLRNKKIATEIIMNKNKNYFISLQVINEVSSNMLRKLDFTNAEIKDFIIDRNCNKINITTI